MVGIAERGSGLAQKQSAVAYHNGVPLLPDNNRPNMAAAIREISERHALKDSRCLRSEKLISHKTWVHCSNCDLSDDELMVDFY
uniref:Uncharacterized protein n=1 Tax=Romanomermis culicivorax TaxID=13658 RepID=A0A915K8E5_ROMCU